MNGARAERIETGVDAGAAALLGMTTACVLLQLDATRGYAATGGALIFAWVYYGLRSIEPGLVSFTLANFAPGEFEPEEPEELILTDADRLHGADNTAADPVLVLDDVLADLGPDSRVVRLFDPAATPTPGQLQARIDRHFGQESPETTPPDASQALYQALAELRRSLR